MKSNANVKNPQSGIRSLNQRPGRSFRLCRGTLPHRGCWIVVFAGVSGVLRRVNWFVFFDIFAILLLSYRGLIVCATHRLFLVWRRAMIPRPLALAHVIYTRAHVASTSTTRPALCCACVVLSCPALFFRLSLAFRFALRYSHAPAYVTTTTTRRHAGCLVYTCSLYRATSTPDQPGRDTP